MAGIDVEAVAAEAARAIFGVLKDAADDIEQFAAAEAKKIATSLEEIAKLRLSGVISQEEAALHLEIQKSASRAVLMAIKGIGIIAAEQAINAALGVITGAINTAFGIAVF